jgi:aminopeptidase-like protein
MPLGELKKHLFSLPEHPDRIPYRTSYYNESWGFCLAHNDLLALRDDIYEVCIDSQLEPGHLVYGEYLIPGESNDEILISTHLPPSLANDNLSGLLATFLATELGKLRRRYIPVSFYPGDHRFDRVALPQSAAGGKDQTWPGAGRCRRFGQVYVQKKPPGRCGD